jgi:hypothetical protein
MYASLPKDFFVAGSARIAERSSADRGKRLDHLRTSGSRRWASDKRQYPPEILIFRGRTLGAEERGVLN